MTKTRNAVRQQLRGRAGDIARNLKEFAESEAGAERSTMAEIGTAVSVLLLAAALYLILTKVADLVLWLVVRMLGMR
jgi:hypothetical protein